MKNKKKNKRALFDVSSQMKLGKGGKLFKQLHWRWEKKIKMRQNLDSIIYCHLSMRLNKKVDNEFQ